jgi:type IV secretion system protein VirB3
MSDANLRRAPIHRALTRRQLLLGCDRDLFFMILLFGLLLLFSGLMSGHLHNLLFAVLIWTAGIPVLGRLAVYDDRFKDIVVRSLRYTQMYLPACGKLGTNTARVSHRRWN